ncbi:JmjC domain-containing histone demethylation protein 1 [Naganishia albida]|nr:JmjC domain-containing histone demethylation protein 1 [Naganishia albida]
MREGKLPAEFLPTPLISPQQTSLNKACLEFSGTALADMIQVPFMQRECDPVYRFPEALEHARNPPASLYVSSAKAGAFTPFHVDSSAEVHWSTVVSGEKWVYLLPPTKHNLKQYKKVANGLREGWIRMDALEKKEWRMRRKAARGAGPRDSVGETERPE